MTVFFGLEKQNIPTLILGFFDGVHTAHKKLIEKARELNLKVAVITFTKSPFEYFNTQNAPVTYISTNAERAKLLEEAGVDDVYFLEFKDFMHLSPEEYLRDVLIKNFSPRHIITGFNHTFGAQKKGDANFLIARQEKYNYHYSEIAPVKHNGVLVSSTNIKHLLAKGQLEEANELLGRYFSIKGQVVHGRKLGRELGFPTANVLWGENIIKLPFGVYLGSVIFENAVHRAIINWGGRGGEPAVEAHILNFNG
ncbi:riboflavin kinase / FMN adenylyltransferase, partial [Candidatus Gastranaerophilus sp. (ex Termes propinquus)]